MYFGELSALGAAFLWSFSSFIFTAASRRIATIQLNITRMIIAAILLALTFWILNINIIINSNQIFYLALSGLIGLVIGDTFLFKAFQMIGPRVSMLIMSANPAMAALIAFYTLGESLTFFGISGIIITLGGIALVVSDSQKNGNSKFKISGIGIVYGFFAAAGQAVGLIFAKLAFFHGDINGLVATFIRIISAVAIMLPLAIITQRFQNPFKLFNKDRKVLGYVLLGSVIGPYLGITFSYLAIIHTKIGIAATLMATAPVIMLPLSHIVYKEKLSWKAIIGALVAVFGVAVLFMV